MRISSGRTVAQAILITLGIIPRTVMGLIADPQLLLQTQALMLLGLMRDVTTKFSWC